MPDMKFTYYCKPGRFLSCREHFVFLGGWIHPPGYIVLQHGTLSPVEYDQIMRSGLIRIYEDQGSDMTYLEQYIPRADQRAYWENNVLPVGKLRQIKYNCFVGMIKVYNRRVIL